MLVQAEELTGGKEMTFFDSPLNGVVTFFDPRLNGVATFFDPPLNGVVTFFDPQLNGVTTFLRPEKTVELCGIFMEHPVMSLNLFQWKKYF